MVTPSQTGPQLFRIIGTPSPESAASSPESRDIPPSVSCPQPKSEISFVSWFDSPFALSSGQVGGNEGAAFRHSRQPLAQRISIMNQADLITPVPTVFIGFQSSGSRPFWISLS
jgi:hypothetical protein